MAGLNGRCTQHGLGSPYATDVLFWPVVSKAYTAGSGETQMITHMAPPDTSRSNCSFADAPEVSINLPCSPLDSSRPQ